MPTQSRANELPFGGPEDLLSRLCHAHRQGLPVVFLVGAPFSAAADGGAHGVPMVSGMLDLVRAQYASSVADQQSLEEQLRTAENQYQAAFAHLIQRRGLDAANKVIRDAVLRAYTRNPRPDLPLRHGEALALRCSELENDLAGWYLPPACKALGELATNAASVFGSCVLTTNFDPLLQIALRAAGGKVVRTVLDQDGNYAQTEADGCHIVHLHGDWYRSDTLHTSLQLGQPRPHLRRSLERLLANRTVVTLAYGGWDDVFTAALAEVLEDRSRRPDILGTFFDADPARVQERQRKLLERLV